MRNPWLAIDVTTSPTARALELRRAWEDFLSGAAAATNVREPITESWRRCTAAGVPPAGTPSLPLLAGNELDDRWGEHPLRRVVPLLRDSLATIAEESQHLIVLSDEEGRLLWIEGDSRVRSSAAEMSFAEGALWSEDAAGTNAIGTALAAEHAVQVFAAEHFNEVVQRWTCSAAPVHDPTTGRVLGVIDLTGRRETVHPHSLGLAVATARAVEAQLRCEQQERDAALRERHLERMVRSPAGRRALVGADGRVLLSEPRGWLPPAVAVPAGGGELTLPGDRRAVAEPLGPDGSFLVRISELRRRYQMPTVSERPPRSDPYQRDTGTW